MKKIFLTIAALLLMPSLVLASNSEPSRDNDDGYYLVTVWLNGFEEWIPLLVNNVGNYETLVDFIVPIFGSRAHFYFCVDGQKYGAPTKDKPLFLGVASKNELVPYDPALGDELYYYTTDAGYCYLLGLYLKFNDDYELDGFYVVSSRGGEAGMQTELGDVNLDCKVDIEDVTVLIDYLLINNLSYYVDKYNADVDQDGVVSISDLTALIDKLLGK